MGFLSMLFGGRRKKSVNYIQKVKAVKLPIAIDKLTEVELKRLLANELKTFKLLDYSKYTPPKLEERTYHSYQIGVLIKCIKEGVLNTIDGIEPTFPSIVAQMPPAMIKKRIYQVVASYTSNVNHGSSDKQLQTQIVWKPIQASFLLYYIVKSYKPPKS